MNKNGNLILSDAVFLILAILFVAMLFIFVARQSSNIYLLEQKTAKELALVIDAAKPGTEIKVLLDNSFINKMDEYKEKPIIIDNANRNVIVKLSDKSGYRYGFFNNADADARIDGNYAILVVR